MHYDRVENSLQAVLERTIPLSRSQLSRVCELSVALMLAGEVTLTKVARQLRQSSDQDSRVRWIKRLLDASFMRHEYVYAPWIRHLIASHPDPTLHLVTDRTDIIPHHLDMVSINLNFRKRSLPIVWELRPTAMTGAETQKDLLNRCKPLIPSDRRVVFHGDNEFGSVAVMEWLRGEQWDFILGQSAKHYCRESREAIPYQLCELPVTRTRSVYRSDVALTKAHWFGPVNVFAFYHPVFHRNRRKQDVRYYATSLPITPPPRRIGKRRWGVECFYKDLKSSGWHLPMSKIQQPERIQSLLISISLVYTWSTCIGRWLCKTSQRSRIDSKPRRHLSLFRIGWDWLVNNVRQSKYCPHLSTLYA